MCIPAMGGGPFGPASVLPRPPASRTRTGTARRSTRLTLPPAEGAATPGLTPPPHPGSAAAARPIGRLLQLGGLAAGAAQEASRTAPVSRTAQVPQPVPATPIPVPRAPRPNVPADAGSDSRLILKQVSQGKMRPVDAILNFEELLTRRNVSPDTRRELTLTFGEKLARASRQRLSVRRAMQEVSAAPKAQTVDGGELLTPSGALQSKANLAEQTADVVSQGASGFNIGLAQGAGLPVDMMTLGLNTSCPAGLERRPASISAR